MNPTIPKHKTVGAHSLDRLQKTNNSRYVLDIAAEQQADVPYELIFCVEHAQKKRPCVRRCENTCEKHLVRVSDCYDMPCKEACKTREAYLGNMYIHYEVKREPLMPNVFRHYFTWHLQAPSPFFDQNMFFYDHKSEKISHLWTVPDKETCLMLLENADKVVPEERELLKFVMWFANGELFKFAKRLNGEQEDSVLLKKD